jgi:hypothetical protein
MTPAEKAASCLRGADPKGQLAGFIAEARRRGDAECVAEGLRVLRKLEERK